MSNTECELFIIEHHKPKEALVLMKLNLEQMVVTTFPFRDNCICKWILGMDNNANTELFY
jgi:hypothetical protein